MQSAFNGERGATLVEYTLAVAFLLLICLVSVRASQLSAKAQLCSLGRTFDDASSESNRPLDCEAIHVTNAGD